MKIAFIIPGNLDVRGGVKRIAEYATRLAKRGHDVQVLCEQLDQPDWLAKKYYNGFRLTSFRDYSNLKVDVAIATGGKSARRLARMRRAKVKVYSVVMQESLNKPTFKNGRHIDRDQYLRDCYEQGWTYIANSSWLKNLVENDFGQKCHLVLGGVSREFIRPVEVEKDPHQLTCLAYGRSQGWKGGARSAHAAELARKSIKRVRIVSYGQSKGPVTMLPLTHHKCPDQSKLAQVYCSADMFLQSSRFEGFCNTAFEAMACGVPVITTDIKGIEDFCIHEKTALFVPVDDVPAMADAIVRLWNDKNLMQELRKNGLEMTDKFEWDKTMESLETIFTQALNDQTS